MIKKTIVTTVIVDFPWILRWVKKYMTIKFKNYNIPNKIKGKKVDLIITDEFDEFMR